MAWQDTTGKQGTFKALSLIFVKALWLRWTALPGLEPPRRLRRALCKMHKIWFLAAYGDKDSNTRPYERLREPVNDQVSRL